MNPATGDMWLNEHGPQGGDEMNLLRPGLNYGWPVVGYGVNYGSGAAIHQGTHLEGMEPPAHVWVPSIGVSGMLFYTGDAFPEWRGDVFVGGMSGQRVTRLEVVGDEIVAEETLIRDLGRVRDIEQGPDGYLYLALDGGTRWEDGPPTPILRMVPAGAR
jgi:glucose/arabinose dehydrogenase